MPKVHGTHRLRSIRIADTITTVSSFLAAGLAAGNLQKYFQPLPGDQPPPSLSSPVLTICILLAIHKLMLEHLYDEADKVHEHWIASHVLRYFLVIAADCAALLVLHGIPRFDTPDNPFIVLYAVTAAILGSSVTLAAHVYSKRWSSNPKNMRNIVFFGSNKRSTLFARYIKDNKHTGLNVVGFVDDENHSHEDINILDRIDNCASVFRNNVIDDVIINLPIRSHYDKINHIIRTAETQGITVHYIADIFNLDKSSLASKSIHGMPSIILHTAPLEDWRMSVKRLLDFVCALVLLIAVSPLLLVVIICIKATSPGPAIFAQDRVGYNKRIFRMYKFRTMCRDAERLQKDLEDRNEMDGAVFKITNDPRITPIGAFLRRYSIDEFPQLYNVLRGDMSMVGPRPLSVRDYSNFSEDWLRRRFSVRPGITCYWQIGGRNDASFIEWMQHDLYYIDNWNLLTDLKIILKTAVVIFKGHGK